MEVIKQHKLITLGIVAFIALLIYTASVSIRQETDQADSPQGVEQTDMNSPISKSSDSLAVNYQTVGDGTIDTVQQPIKIFGFDTLKLSPEVKESLRINLEEGLRRELPPTYAQSYAHIDSNVSKCLSVDDCSLGVYVDSPESYFSLRIYNDGGSPAFTLRRIGLPGVTQ